MFYLVISSIESVTLFLFLYFRFGLLSSKNLSSLPDLPFFTIVPSSFIPSFSSLHSIIHFSIFFSLFLIEYKEIYIYIY